MFRDEEDNILNILLLGATGSGKTTLINSLSKSSGSFNNSNESTSPSSTQSVKEYIINSSNQKIRFIDTPGIGHIEGPEKDYKILSNIFTQISKYKKIHGIFIVFNLHHQWLTYYITKLLRHLHKNAVKNILFFCTHLDTPYNDYERMSTILCYISDGIKKRGIKLLTDFTKDLYLIDYNNVYSSYRRGELYFNSDLLLKHFVNYFNEIEPHDVEETLALNEAQKFYIFIHEKAGVDESIVLKLAGAINANGIYLFYDIDGIVDDYLCGKSVETVGQNLEKEYHNQRFNNFAIQSFHFMYAPEYMPMHGHVLNEMITLIKGINDKIITDENNKFNINLMQEILTMKPYAEKTNFALNVQHIPAVAAHLAATQRSSIEDITCLATDMLLTERIEYLKKAKKAGHLYKNSGQSNMHITDGCPHCGKYEDHQHSKCYAKKKVCSFCEKKGHVIRVCKLREDLLEIVMQKLFPPKSPTNQNDGNAKTSDDKIAAVTDKVDTLKISTKPAANVMKKKPTAAAGLSKANQSNSKRCYFCGSDKYHPYAICYAKKEICKKCNKKGHIEKACCQKVNQKTNVPENKPKTYKNRNSNK